MSNPFPELRAYDPAYTTPRQVKPRDPESWLADELRRERSEEIKRTIVDAPAADQVARGSRVAREANVSPIMVDGRLDEAEKALNADKLNDIAVRYPAIGKWAANNPRGVVAAQDDHKSLGLLGEAFEGLKRLGRGIGNSLAAGSYSSVAGLYEITDPIAELGDAVSYYAVDAPIATIGSMTGLFDYDPDALDKKIGTLAERNAARRTRMRGEASRLTEAAKTGDWWVDATLQGLQSVPITLVGAATRNPSMIAGLPAATVVGNEYREGRDQGLDAGTALRYGLTQGGIEALTEKIPASRLAQDIALKTPFGKMFVSQIAAELPGEQVATALQDFTEWAYLNPDKPFSSYVEERPEAALSTALATIGGVGAQTGAIQIVQKAGDIAGKVAARIQQGTQARDESAILDQAAKAVESSKLRQRDPEAFRTALREAANDAGSSYVFVDAEAVQAYMQSDSYDDGLSGWSSQIEEAAATGGDFVLPIEEALSSLPGTPAWAALKDHMRLTPGGFSAVEAQSFDEAMDQVMADLSDEMDRAEAVTKQARSVREKLTDSIAQALQASYTADAARQMAEVTAQYLQTRASRLGQELTGDEFSSVEVRQVLPEALGKARKADATDLVINALRQGKDPARQSGKTLIEWIADRGGVNDTGGDLKAMGLGEWHKAKKFRRKAVREFSPELSMGITGQGDFGLDSTLRAAIDAGYFPELQEVMNEAGVSTLDASVLMDAINEELAGTARYAQEAVVDHMREAAEELRQMLLEAGHDPDAMTDADMREFVAGLDEASGQEGFEQAYSPQLAAEIDAAIDGGKTRGFIEISQVPAALFAYGVPEGVLRLGRNKLNSVMRDHPALPRELLYRLPQLLARPWAIFPSSDTQKGGRIVVALSARDSVGDPVLVILQPDNAGSIVVSIYGKEGADGKTGDERVMEMLANERAKGGKVFEGTPPPASYSDPISDMRPERARKPILSVRKKGNAFQQEARGQIVFDQGRVLIELFQSRNLSTYFHEFGHMALENLRADAAMEGAPDTLKADWQTVQDWFKANGVKIEDMIPTEAHEMWARGFERYLMEGKAPSSALARIFETIRSWMVSIYKTVDNLRSPITPEIREVMDRLIATDAEIEATREMQAISALFKDAASVGMSAAEFTAYQDQVESARTQAHQKLVDKTLAAFRRRETTRYREMRKGVREEVQADVDARPLFRALRSLKTQPVSAEWVRNEMGEDALGLLPRRVPPLARDGGVHPDSVAEQSGFATGRDMIEALIGAELAHRQAKEGGDQRPLRERTIETETDEEMNRRVGDTLNDGSIEREALAAVHNEMQGEVIASEIRVLARQTGRRPTPYALAREWARNRVRSGSVVQEASASAIQRHARAAAKAGRAAEQAMLAKDMDEAFRQKQFQMLNNALLSEAKSAADEVDSAVKRMARIASNRTMKSVDQDYLDQAHSLLEAVDLRKRSQKSIDRQGKWAEWAAAREAEGFDLIVPPSFEATIGKTNWTRLPVTDILALDDAVKQIIHLGRLKQTLLDNQEAREWEEVFGEAEASADNIGRKPPVGSFAELGWWDAVKARAATVDAALLKMEQVFDWLDSGNSNGVFNRIAFRPIAEAQAREQAMTKDYFTRMREALETVPAATIRTWGDKVTLDLIDPETGLPAVMERKKLVAMALNWGNAGNRQRLADGYGWSPAGIEAALMGNLTEAEWAFVQRTWDIIDTLWPQIEAMERAINGVAPDKIEAVEVVTPFGKLKGGYYPAIYDTALDYTAEEQEGKRADLFDAKYTRASTRASATQERAEKVSRPILLDIGVINRHLGEVIHDVTHREAVMQAHRFLTNRRVMKAVDDTLGPEIRKQFRPWLQYIANSWAQDRAGNEGLGKFMSKARANTTVVGMGWRFTTILTQVSGYSNSFEYVGAKWVTAAIAQTGADPVGTFDFVMERSDEMRHRIDTLDRDIRAEVARMESATGGAVNKLTAVKRFAFHGIGYMDRIVTVPTWLGAYNKAISEGMSEQDAAYAGDKAVRLSQGAAGPKDLAAVATGQGRYGEALKWMTMFYSYLSTVYNRQRSLGRDVAMGQDVSGLIARAWWLIVVPPLLAELLSGRGPDDEEDPAWWAFKKMLSQSVGAIPGVRDVTDPVLSGLTGDWSFGYRLSPVQSAGESVVRVAKDVGNIADGDETTRATRNAMEMVGYFTGLVPGQIAASTQFLVDVGYGDADPETLSEWYEGLTKGRIKDD